MFGRYRWDHGSAASVARAPARATTLLVVGPVVALAFNIATLGIRSEIHTANIALLLALAIVAVAAFGGQIPAMSTSLVAAAAFNVMHTRPYWSFKIESGADILTTILLVVTGLVAGFVTERGWETRYQEIRRISQIENLHRIAELAVAANDIEALWPVIRDTLCDELRLGRCWFEPEADRMMHFPELAHTGTLEPTEASFKVSRGGYEIPINGAELVIPHAGQRLGRLILLPDPGHPISLLDFRFAVAVADQFALVAARTETLPPLW